MITDDFIEAARAEAEEYTPTDEEVRTDYVMAYADRDSSQLLAGMAFDRWLAKRDDLILRQQRYIEELEAGRITPRTHLAAQEPTDAEVEAGEESIDCLFGWEHLRRYGGQSEEWMDQLRKSITHNVLSAARAARRDDTSTTPAHRILNLHAADAEGNCTHCTRGRVYPVPAPCETVRALAGGGEGR